MPLPRICCRQVMTFHGAGTAWSQRRGHHHDLHACAESGRWRCPQPGGHSRLGTMGVLWNWIGSASTTPCWPCCC
jgi:hypothetical protein